jgi:hypothetical protein
VINLRKGDREMEIKKNLFRATLGEISEIGDIIIEYQDEDKNGKKILLKIAEKLHGVILKIEKFDKIEKFESVKWKVTFIG